MPDLFVMFKTVSTDCNLDCNYCYYRASLEDKNIQRIDPSMLEAFMPQYMEYVADSRQAVFGWQGGEPTLAGLDFFRWVIALEAQHARPGTAISNMLQTNGTLLNDDWGSFLHTYDFLVGVSLDGPETIHDIERKDRGGHGSFRRVMAGVNVLRRHDVELNILCVIGPHNVTRARELMKFFGQEGLTYLQFMPAMGFQASEPEKPPAYLVSPEQYGGFLVDLFDEWYAGGIPQISIRTFDNFLQSYLGIPNDLCIHSDACNAGIVVEYNGDVYPCDFYIHPQWKLGNIFQQPLKEMADSPKLRAFIGRKQTLPAECQTCQWRKLCNGGCVRNRSILKDGRQKAEYFCRGYQRLFSHADSRLQLLSQRIVNYRRYLQQLKAITKEHKPVPGAKDPCPCGSSQKHILCCGTPELPRSYLFQPDSQNTG